MLSADTDMIQDIPGYTAILKTVIKSQIQLLVQQLADQTGEESLLLTASLSEGSLSHLGSESGTVFLEDHEDIKSQFLRFCLKRQRKQHDGDNLPDLGPKYRVSLPQETLEESVPWFSPRQNQSSTQDKNSLNQGLSCPLKPHLHSLTTTKTPHREARSNRRRKPYPQNYVSVVDNDSSKWDEIQASKESTELKGGAVIKIEPLESDDQNGSTDTESIHVPVSMVTRPDPFHSSHKLSFLKDSQSVSHRTMSPSTSVVGSENEDDETTPNDPPAAKEIRSDSCIPESSSITSKRKRITTVVSSLRAAHEQAANASGVTAKSGSVLSAAKAADSTDPDNTITVKAEPVSDSETIIEGTGMESGLMAGTDDSWMSGVSGVKGYPVWGFPDEGDMTSYQPNPQYSLPGNGERSENNIPGSRKKCQFCMKTFKGKGDLARHLMIHTGEKPFKCSICRRCFNRKSSLHTHLKTHMTRETAMAGKTSMSQESHTVGREAHFVSRDTPMIQIVREGSVSGNTHSVSRETPLIQMQREGTLSGDTHTVSRDTSMIQMTREGSESGDIHPVSRNTPMIQMAREGSVSGDVHTVSRNAPMIQMAREGSVSGDVHTVSRNAPMIQMAREGSVSGDVHTVSRNAPMIQMAREGSVSGDIHFVSRDTPMLQIASKGSVSGDTHSVSIDTYSESSGTKTIQIAKVASGRQDAYYVMRGDQMVREGSVTKTPNL